MAMFNSNNHNSIISWEHYSSSSSSPSPSPSSSNRYYWMMNTLNPSNNQHSPLMNNATMDQQYYNHIQTQPEKNQHFSDASNNISPPFIDFLGVGALWKHKFRNCVENFNASKIWKKLKDISFFFLCSSILSVDCL